MKSFWRSRSRSAASLLKLDDVVIPVQVGGHLVRGAVQEAVEPADREEPLPRVHRERIDGGGPRPQGLRARLGVDPLTDEHDAPFEAVEVLGQLLVEFPKGESEVASDLRPAQDLLHRLREEDDLHRHRGRDDQLDGGVHDGEQGVGDRGDGGDSDDEPEW